MNEVSHDVEIKPNFQLSECESVVHIIATKKEARLNISAKGLRDSRFFEHFLTMNL